MYKITVLFLKSICHCGGRVAEVRRGLDSRPRLTQGSRLSSPQLPPYPPHTSSTTPLKRKCPRGRTRAPRRSFPGQVPSSEMEGGDSSAANRSLALQILKERLTWGPSAAELCSRYTRGCIDGGEEKGSLSASADVCRPGGPDDEDITRTLLPSNAENLRQLLSMMTSTLEARTNSSVFLIGPHGSGKSLVLHAVLQQILSTAAEAWPSTILPLYINARHFGDEPQAVNAISSQLMSALASAGDEEAGSENGPEPVPGCADIRTLVELYCSGRPGEDGGSIKRRAVVLILDDFDVFAGRTRQTLLYSVFDALQSPTACISVVGLSCRHDAEQLLEKRVRSRHSGRSLVFLPPTPEELCGLSLSLLTLSTVYPKQAVADPAREAQSHEQEQQDTSTGAPDAISTPPEGRAASAPAVAAVDTAGAAEAWPALAERFNASVTSLLGAPERPPAALAAHLSQDLSPPSFLRLLFRAVCSAAARAARDGQTLMLTLGDLEAAASPPSSSSRIQTLQGLSVLELFLLVAMRKLQQRQKAAVNFTMVFAEYRSFLAHSRATGGSSDLYSAELSKQAFMRLLQQGLIAQVSGGGGMARRDMLEYILVQSAVFAVELEKALEGHRHCPVSLKSWLKQEINPGLSSSTLW